MVVEGHHQGAGLRVQKRCVQLEVAIEGLPAKRAYAWGDVLEPTIFATSAMPFAP
jgi:hypothetical protein